MQAFASPGGVRMKRIGGTCAIAALCVVPATAFARVDITPYIEVDQTVIDDIKGGDDGILTYTTLAAGADGSVSSRRAEAGISLRYEHQFGWNRRTPDQDILSGLARARYWVIPETLNIEGTGFASRLRGDGYYGANSSLVSAGDRTDDLYSFSVGPTFTTRVGDLLVNAAYRFGYTKIDSGNGVTVADAPFSYGAFGRSIYHSLTASVGMKPEEHAFGWTLSAGYDRENASELKQHYSDKWVRGDVTVPLTSTFALVGGIGYEKMTITQQSVLVDGEGAPIIGDNGRYVGDPSAPRLLAYDTDGLIWDAGVLWRPSQRTSLEARVGRRYESMNYSGTFNWKPGLSTSVQIAYFDTIDSFGRGLTNSLSTIPFSFDAIRNPFTGDLTGCVSGEEGVACLNDLLAGITATNYRRRGVSAQVSRSRGLWNSGVALSWSRRKFLAPSSGILSSLNGLKDDYYYGTAFVGVRLDPASTLTGTVYGSYTDSNMIGTSIANYGGYLTYAHQYGRRLTAQAAIGIDTMDGRDIEQVISLIGRVGVRYQF